MISLTRLDGRAVLVNEDQLLYAERTPDTVLIFSTGLRLMVKEPLSEVEERAAAYRRRTARSWDPPPDPDLPVIPPPAPLRED